MALDDERYGFTRTICDCPACTAPCHHVSGMVTPADLTRWRTGAARMGDAAGLETWLRATLAASPGALVARQGVRFRIPTMVPRRHPTGQCVLFEAGRCSIHSLAPYGCSHFDLHMSVEEGNRRSAAALMAIYQDWQAGGPYSQLWKELEAAGQVVEAPEVARQRLAHP